MEYSVESLCRTQSEQFVALSVEFNGAYRANPSATTAAYVDHQLATNIEMLYLLLIATEIELADAGIQVPTSPSL